MDIKYLQDIGMNANEAKTYLAILELGDALMSQIVKKTKIKRTTLYDVVKSLQDKGLISMTRKNKRGLYVAENPNKILEQLENRKNNFESMLPELLSISNSIGTKPKIRYFEGLEGIKEVYKDILRFPHETIRAWAPEVLVEGLGSDFFEDFYFPQLIKQNTLVEMFAPNLPFFIKHKEENTMPTRKIKLVDSTKFPFSIEITLYGYNNVGVISYRDQMGLIIESKAISETLKSIFKMQWEMSN